MHVLAPMLEKKPPLLSVLAAMIPVPPFSGLRQIPLSLTTFYTACSFLARTVLNTLRKKAGVIKTSVSPGIWNTEVKAWYRAENFLYPTGSSSAEVKVGKNNTASVPMVKAYYEPGDTGPGGGIIFYVADGREGRNFGFLNTYAGKTCHYLEAAPSDIAGPYLVWAPMTSPAFTSPVPGLSINPDITDQAIGRGMKNTALILACVSSPATDAPAAHACDTYSSPNGTDDWFLPSKEEQDELYERWNTDGRPAKYNLSTAYLYWTSSQYQPGDACYLDFNTGV